MVAPHVVVMGPYLWLAKKKNLKLAKIIVIFDCLENRNNISSGITAYLDH